jgi:hypothetical protein
VDWTNVVSGAITGLVGIAGVAGTIIAARIAGNSARESAGLSIAAEERRARLTDKRQVYARFVGDLYTAAALAKDTKFSEDSSSDRADFEAARRDFFIRGNELILIAPLPVADLARQAMVRLDDYCWGKCDFTALTNAGDKAFVAFSADLEQGDAGSGPGARP